DLLHFSAAQVHALEGDVDENEFGLGRGRAPALFSRAVNDQQNQVVNGIVGVEIYRDLGIAVAEVIVHRVNHFVVVSVGADHGIFVAGHDDGIFHAVAIQIAGEQNLPLAALMVHGSAGDLGIWGFGHKDRKSVV